MASTENPYKIETAVQKKICCLNLLGATFQVILFLNRAFIHSKKKKKKNLLFAEKRKTIHDLRIHELRIVRMHIFMENIFGIFMFVLSFHRFIFSSLDCYHTRT